MAFWLSLDCFAHLLAFAAHPGRHTRLRKFSSSIMRYAANNNPQVSAGNTNVDAGTRSPASAPTVNTCGAMTIADARASFSNYGSSVDVFAPGKDIISCGLTSSRVRQIMNFSVMISRLIPYRQRL